MEQFNNVTHYFQSPFGLLKISANSKGLTSIYYANDNKNSSDTTNPHIKKFIKEIEEYHKKKRTSFTAKLDLGASGFKKSVLNQLIKIPFGRTESYKNIAIAIGSPKAARAVGNACRTNPISIIIPCHRVIGSNQKLTGYAGGLDKKALLLRHEGAI